MHLVCIGGSDAGISAGLRALELEPDTDVTIVLADAYPNLSICGLPFFLSGETPRWQDLAHRSVGDLEAAGLALAMDTVVERIDADAHEIACRGEDGTRQTIGYDALLIGTGAHPVTPPLEGLDLPGVHVLRTMDHAFDLADTLAGSGHVVVVGAGYIGVELADALAHRGIPATLVEMEEAVLTTVDPELGHRIGARLTEAGVDVRPATSVTGIEQHDGRLAVGIADGGAITADAVVVSVGVAPRTGLGTDLGIPTGAGGALVVDRAMRTGVPDVFAAGDCVHTHHRLLDEPTWLPLGTTAHKQGRVAGANAVGHAEEYPGTLGTQAVKIVDLVCARTGLRPQEAEAAGYDPATVEVTVDDHKHYYPGATDLTVRLTCERSDGRILGAQLLGSLDAEVSKRADVLAVAIHHGMRAAEIADLDLSYTPPLSAPWDPVAQAAQTWGLTHG